MLRNLTTLFILLCTAGIARAHFIFVVPDPGAATAKVIFSESLSRDADVNVALAGGTKLTMRDADGKEVLLTLSKGEHVYTLDTPGSGTRVINGLTDLGVMQRGDAPPNHLLYYPRTIIGDAFDPKAAPQSNVAVELLPIGKPGEVRLELRIDGKPKSDAEITVILPDETQEQVKTGADGRTPAFTQSGRYGAWARHWQDQTGEIGGKKFEQVRHYATIVFDAGSAAPATRPSAGRPNRGRPNPHARASEKPAVASAYSTKLPEATSSFGGVALDGWLYIYGGHIAPTHDYSTQAVSGRFSRLNLADGKTWEELPGGTGMQGLNLAVHGGRVIRIGGMRPRNAPGEDTDNWSSTDCATYDPTTRTWKPLPPLPEPRSSHDLVVVGDTLFVIGGWDLRGKDGETKWHDTLLTLDLSASEPTWKSMPQPFQRRALIAAVFDGKVYVIGGFDEEDRPSRRVDIYDPKTETWSVGPGLPGAEINGFAPAACVHDGKLYVSVGDGTFSRLNTRENLWEIIATATPRIVHRLIPSGPNILIVGGAAEGENFDLIESVQVQQPNATVKTSTP